MTPRRKRMVIVAGILVGVSAAAWLGLQAFKANVMLYYDPTDLAAKMPAKLKEMQDAFYEEAAKYDALPIDSRGFDRLQDSKTYRAKPRTHYVLERNPFWYEGGAWPDVKNKSWTMATSITVESGAAQGMIAGQGGRFCGWGLYLIEGKPVFLCRYSHKDADATRIASAAATARRAESSWAMGAPKTAMMPSPRNCVTVPS